VPNIGLVLAGGFAKGAYQVGVLNAIKEYFGDEQIKYISASSIGVLNAYAFVQDKMDLAAELWRGQKFSGVRSFVNAYARSSHVNDIIRENVAGLPSGQRYFYATYLNLTSRKLNYVNLCETAPENIKGFMKASVSLPLLTKPVDIAGIKYADGAVVDNIPVKPLMKHPFDYAIVVHFDQNNYVFENDYFDSKLIKINFLDNSIIKDSLAFDKDSVDYMIKSGFEECMTIFDMVFKNGPDDIESVYQRIRFLNDLRGKRSFRLTGDIVVTNMNRVLKRIIRAKI